MTEQWLTPADIERLEIPQDGCGHFICIEQRDQNRQLVFVDDRLVAIEFVDTNRR